MPPSGVQVGSVYDGIGDPTTLGWPSTGKCERLLDKEVENKGNVPLIPPLPISWADGDAIIRTISGKVANVDWQGGKNSPIYRVGPGPAIANLSYEVQDPDNSSQTIYQSWLASDNDTTLGRLGGAGSDYAAFVQHIGTPALDMSFGNGYPVYHSMYDDFVWMKKFGDPMFHRHAADDEVLPFNHLSYAIELQKSAEDLEGEISDNGISLVPLYASIEKLRKAAKN
ncbi:hypothetical protein T459_18649 [Capsicum annuum]|uniref:Uncharacterized protein n=1 Tax=Capsicum annuum TaxID=4072 RepID=A0A2G2YZD0_CAPAN|nr:hypothetical protein T459_18649 [Capsicum annuum]